MDNTDNATLADGVEVEVKGPGKQWKWRDAYLRKQEAQAASGEEVDYEIKGPGPEWETDSEGVYVNRDEDE
jgi:hypothetical protein